ncbi:MAG: hypothetical protein ABI318_10910, partial [Chthoniobacteraceae bacterium]
DNLRTGARVSLQELPSQFPSERTRQRMLDALMMSGLIEQHREKNMTWLRFGALAPAIFRSGPASLPTPDDPFAGMPHMKIRPRARLLHPPDDGESGD